MARYQCPFCNLSFAFQSSLCRHKQGKHHDNDNLQDKHTSILCHTCSIKFSTITKLIEHQNECHCANIIVSKHCFANRSQFEIWKKQEEESSKSLYVQHSGAGRMHGHNRKRYYYCHRSGQFRSKGKGLRNLKAHGSIKVGDYCTAHMTMSEDTITNKVTVLYCKHHNNHIQVDQDEGGLGLVEVDALTDEKYVPRTPSVNGDFEMNNCVETVNKDKTVHENDHCYAKVLQQPPQKLISLWEAKRDLMLTVAELQVLVEGCSDTKTHIAINEHLSAAISVLKAATEANQPQAAIVVRKRPASNTSSEHHQLRVVRSTKNVKT